MFEFILDVIGEFIMLPILWIICTPWILLRNIFRKGNYLDNIKKSYHRVTEFWKGPVIKFFSKH